MGIQKATRFIDDVIADFKTNCDYGDYYKNDVVLILTQNEINELHVALKEWVDQNNIIKVQTVARINNEINQFLSKIEEE